MTTTMPLAVDDRIREFADAVRVELDDLPRDDVDDLTDGLEADLIEQANESEDEFVLPDAAAYATELRAAAGLPARAVSRAALPFFARMNAAGPVLVARVRTHRMSSAFLDFFIALRPVWWVARGWALYAMLPPWFGQTNRIVGFPQNNTGGWLLLGALVVLSVQWGRGRWAPHRWGRVLRITVSVITAMALPFLMLGAIAAARSVIEASNYSYQEMSTPGMAVDGERVRNLFAYDADGNPITQVQLFDQDGRALTTVSPQEQSNPIDSYFDCGGGPVPVAVTAPGRAPVWNIFPLQELDPGRLGYCTDSSTTEAATPTFPFVQVPSIRTASAPGESPEPTPGAQESQEPAPDTPAAPSTPPTPEP